MTDEDQSDDNLEFDSEPEFDEELMALAEDEPPSVLRPILMISVIAMALWIITDWRSELEYFFSSSDPVEIGDATDFASKLAEDPDWHPDIPHNRYVTIKGIPSRRSQSSRYRYSRLVGSWIFIEEKRADADMDPIERELKGTAKGDVDRTYFEGSGRIIDFSQMPERYHGLRSYYTSRYNLHFCNDLTPESKAEILRKRRDSIVQQWKTEFEEANEETRRTDKLTPEPTDAEIQEIQDNNPVCVDAYLVQVDTQPKDFWWYLAATLMFVGFMLLNMFFLIRWVRTTMRD